MYAPDSDTNAPCWLNSLVNDVISCFTELGETPPIGCHFFHVRDSDTWEVALFVGRAEIVGGADDGRELPVLMVIDVGAVCELFDAPPKVGWQAARGTAEADLGTYLSFSGQSQGKRVLLRILEEPPDWVGIGRLVDATTGQFRDLW